MRRVLREKRAIHRQFFLVPIVGENDAPASPRQPHTKQPDARKVFDRSQRRRKSARRALCAQNIGAHFRSSGISTSNERSLSISAVRRLYAFSKPRKVDALLSEENSAISSIFWETKRFDRIDGDFAAFTFSLARLNHLPRGLQHAVGDEQINAQAAFQIRKTLCRCVRCSARPSHGKPNRESENRPLLWPQDRRNSPERLAIASAGKRKDNFAPTRYCATCPRFFRFSASPSKRSTTRAVESPINRIAKLFGVHKIGGFLRGAALQFVQNLDALRGGDRFQFFDAQRFEQFVDRRQQAAVGAPALFQKRAVFAAPPQDFIEIRRARVFQLLAVGGALFFGKRGVIGFEILQNLQRARDRAFGGARSRIQSVPPTPPDSIDNAQIRLSVFFSP